MGKQAFTGTLEAANDSGGRWIVVPLDVKEAFGEARPRVRGTVNGCEFESRLSVYGGVTYLGLRSEIRRAASIEVGDRVEVVLDRDDRPRTVELPPELDRVLDDDPTLRATYDALAFTHRREYAEWVGGAKKEPTRLRRAAKAAEMLAQGQVPP